MAVNKNEDCVLDYFWSMYYKGVDARGPLSGLRVVELVKDMRPTRIRMTLRYLGAEETFIFERKL